MAEDNGYPRILDRKGCLHGRSVHRTLMRHEDQQEVIMKEFKDALKTQGKILFGILVTLTTSSILLALNLIIKGG